jgi:plastocyanin
MKKVLLVVLAVAVAAAIVAIPALAATTTVKVGDNYFGSRGKKPTITVKRGTTVRWTWVGHVPHNVKVASGPKRFGSATLTRGSFSARLTRPGTYKIVCTIHQPDMVMTLKVR